MCKSTDELTKNRPADDKGSDGGLMYEKPGPNCPVVSFELYLSHLNPLNEFLFQHSKRMFGTTTWWSVSVHLVSVLAELVSHEQAKMRGGRDPCRLPMRFPSCMRWRFLNNPLRFFPLRHNLQNRFERETLVETRMSCRPSKFAPEYKCSLSVV